MIPEESNVSKPSESLKSSHSGGTSQFFAKSERLSGEEPDPIQANIFLTSSDNDLTSMSEKNLSQVNNETDYNKDKDKEKDKEKPPEVTLEDPYILDYLKT